MTILIRAVISGFGLSLGAALFKKIAKELGLDDSEAKATPTPAPTPAPGDDADVARA